MFDWVDILESKLDSMSPVGTDLETVKQQIVELKVQSCICVWIENSRIFVYAENRISHFCTGLLMYLFVCTAVFTVIEALSYTSCVYIECLIHNLRHLACFTQVQKLYKNSLIKQSHRVWCTIRQIFCWKGIAGRVSCIVHKALYFCWLIGCTTVCAGVSGVQSRGVPAADWDGAPEPPGGPPAEEGDGGGWLLRHQGANVRAQDALGQPGWEDHQPTGEEGECAGKASSQNEKLCNKIKYHDLKMLIKRNIG